MDNETLPIAYICLAGEDGDPAGCDLALDRYNANKLSDGAGNIMTVGGFRIDATVKDWRDQLGQLTRKLLSEASARPGVAILDADYWSIGLPEADRIGEVDALIADLRGQFGIVCVMERFNGIYHGTRVGKEQSFFGGSLGLAMRHDTGRHANGLFLSLLSEVMPEDSKNLQRVSSMRRNLGLARR